MNGIIPKRTCDGNVKACGRVWPDGQFTLGYAPGGGLERLESEFEHWGKCVPAIGSSIGSKSHKLFSIVDDGSGKGRDSCVPGRGQGGISAHGRRLLSNAVSFLQRRHGRGRLSFVTLTIPGVSYEESWNLSSNWATILRVFYQKLGRAQAKRGIPPHYAGCTEMQPTRSDREGHPALHLHFVMVGKARNSKGWAFTPSEIRDMWRSVIERYLWGEYSFDACENVQRVKRNAAGYLAKYVSKGGGEIVPPPPCGTGWKLPSSWHNISAKLRRYVLDRVRRSPEFISLVESLLRIPEFSEAFHYCAAGVIPELNTPGPHFYYGRIKGEMLRELEKIYEAWLL